MRKNRQWSRLENAAKIFPPTSNHRDTKVFRFCCELYEPVDPEVLQGALDRAVRQFPFYRSILKKGLFWYYFETTDLRPVVHRETKPPCAPLYNADRKNLLFEVTYYGRRINLEIYHALADGTGALHFLRLLVFYYLTEKHGIPRDTIAMDYGASEAQKRGDAFSKYYAKEQPSSLPRGPKAHRIRGERLPEYRLGVVEGVMSTQALLKEARSHGATVTELLATLLILAIHEGMTLGEEDRPVVLTVPVNLRKVFPSPSARNFFCVVKIGYRFREGDDTFETVLAHVRENLRAQLDPELLRRRMNQLSALEHNFAAKLVPLGLKDMVLRLANWMDAREITASFSNVGRVTMPPEVAPYIRLFDVFCSTTRLQTCLCSFEDNFLVSFSSPYINNDIQCAFFRSLTGRGIPVEVSASLPEEE